MVAVMTKSTQHDTRPTLVVGLGDSGFSVVRFLVRRGVYPVVADSRDAPPMVERLSREFPDIQIHLGPFDAALFAAFPRVIVSPGVSLAESALRAAQAAGAEILGDVELFAQVADAPVIAVTGSNGKSTVTALVGELLAAVGVEARVGGNIGVPALDLVDDDAPDFYVLELSSFQLETTSTLETTSAVVLNVSPDHMDRYRDVAAYGRAKGRIYDHCAHCVVNRDDVRAMSLAPATRTGQYSFGLSAPEHDDEFGLVEDAGRRWLAQGEKRLLAADRLHLQGRHNIGNVLAAFALIHAAGIEISPAMTERARTFAGLPHRMELVADHDGVRWINDSKGTNVGATCAALQGIDAPVVLIAGGQGKGADFSPLAQAAFGRVTHAIVLGVDRAELDAALGVILPVTEVDSLAAAVKAAATIAHAGDVVLFSPACASFDMFRNFEHRGDVFRALVREQMSCRR
jgi:UDP-N-acetylmuramoylalanine--D-glutamate ligase